MKKINWILLLLLIAGITLYSSCGGTDDGPPPPPEDTPQERKAAELAQNWSLGTNGSVRRDGQDVSDTYSNFIVTFTESGTSGSYTSSGGGDVWVDGGGSWTFTSSNPIDASSITIGSNNISINVSGTSLILQFSIAEDAAGIGARVAGIDGDWEFSMETN